MHLLFDVIRTFLVNSLRVEVVFALLHLWRIGDAIFLGYRRLILQIFFASEPLIVRLRNAAILLSRGRAIVGIQLLAFLFGLLDSFLAFLLDPVGSILAGLLSLLRCLLA